MKLDWLLNRFSTIQTHHSIFLEGFIHTIFTFQINDQISISFLFHLLEHMIHVVARLFWCFMLNTLILPWLHLKRYTNTCINLFFPYKIQLQHSPLLFFIGVLLKFVTMQCCLTDERFSTGYTSLCPVASLVLLSHTNGWWFFAANVAHTETRYILINWNCKGTIKYSIHTLTFFAPFRLKFFHVRPFFEISLN